jgi:cyanophycinase
MSFHRYLILSLSLFSVAFCSHDFAAKADDSGASAPNLDRRPTDDLPIRERLYQEGIRGTLVICGGGEIPEDAKQQFAASVDKNKPTLILPTASDKPEAAVTAASAWLKDLGILEIISPPSANTDEERIASLSAEIRRAGSIWICGGQQSRIADAYVGTDVEVAIGELLDHGGVIGGTSAGAAIMSKQMIASGKSKPEIRNGFDLVPDCIVDQHFSQRERLGRLRQAIAQHPAKFGLGIDEATAVIIKGRNIDVIGEGFATIVLANVVGIALDGQTTGARDEVIQKMPTKSRADLTQLRRSARWRASGVDPGEPLNNQRTVPKGSLVIVGGGGMPKEIVDRFIELAGGTEAKIVVLPTAGSREDAFQQRPPRFLSSAGVKRITMLPQSRTEEVASEEFRVALEQATGVWFDGGRQWNFVDAYENTAAVEMFHDVLRRGGVIGGSSAGATIQGEYLVRGHPLGNFVMMAEGYERGFAFLPGVAIDQHFSQRNRFPDLIPVVQRHPKMLGVGIDESTAIVVTQSRADVVGRGAAHFITNELIESVKREKPEDATNLNDTRRFYRTVDTGNSIDLETLKPFGEDPQ